MHTPLPDGLVYTETVVHIAPERYVSEAPYQIAIVDIAGVGHKTVRILAEAGQRRVSIGERVTFDAYRDGVPCYRRSVDANSSDSSNK
jgi:uncharacterized OB-fold protein